MSADDFDDFFEDTSPPGKQQPEPAIDLPVQTNIATLIERTNNVLDINRVILRSLTEMLAKIEMTADYSKPQNLRMALDLIREIRQTSLILIRYGQEDQDAENVQENEAIITAENVVAFLAERHEELLPEFVAWLHQQETSARIRESKKERLE